VRESVWGGMVIEGECTGGRDSIGRKVARVHCNAGIIGL